VPLTPNRTTPNALGVMSPGAPLSAPTLHRSAPALLTLAPSVAPTSSLSVATTRSSSAARTPSDLNRFRGSLFVRPTSRSLSSSPFAAFSLPPAATGMGQG
jgi:hypothetical protein